MPTNKDVYTAIDYNQIRNKRMKTPKRGRAASVRIQRSSSVSQKRMKGRRKSKQKDLYKSVKRVKDLTEK